MPPRFLANLPLVLQMPKDRAAWEKAASEGTKVLTFRTIPSANKIEIRQMLERLYGLKVKQVDTLNREGQMKRNARFNYHYRVPDIKLAYVKLAEAVKFPPPPEKLKTEEKKDGSA